MSDYDLQHFCELAIEWGASDAKVIPVANIHVAEWVRLKCQYGCPEFGTRLTCPPFSPTPDMTRKVLSDYFRAIILKFTAPADDFDWKLPHSIAVKVEREVFLNNYYKAFSYGCGPCPYCSKCDLKKCIHGDVARPSMEASGIDVYATARDSGLVLDVVKTEDAPITCYSLVLID
jgi:predicted metal-binding protein